MGRPGPDPEKLAYKMVGGGNPCLPPPLGIGSGIERHGAGQHGIGFGLGSARAIAADADHRLESREPEFGRDHAGRRALSPPHPDLQGRGRPRERRDDGQGRRGRNRQIGIPARLSAGQSGGGCARLCADAQRQRSGRNGRHEGGAALVRSQSQRDRGGARHDHAHDRSAEMRGAAAPTPTLRHAELVSASTVVSPDVALDALPGGCRNEFGMTAGWGGGSAPKTSQH